MCVLGRYFKVHLTFVWIDGLFSEQQSCIRLMNSIITVSRMMLDTWLNFAYLYFGYELVTIIEFNKQLTYCE